VSFVQPNPATIPGLEVDPLAEARLDHQQLPCQPGGDPLV